MADLRDLDVYHGVFGLLESNQKPASILGIKST